MTQKTVKMHNTQNEHNNIYTCVLNYILPCILLVLVIFIGLYYFYYGTDLSYLTKFSLNMTGDNTGDNTGDINNSKPQPTFTPEIASSVNKRIKDLTNLKEQFTNLTTPLTNDQINTILKKLGMTDSELSNISVNISAYADQVAANDTISNDDKQKTLDLLAQIYIIKLNDSINKLNSIAYVEYVKSKDKNLQFAP